MKPNVNGQKVKELRKQKGWSQNTLATMAGVSLKTIQRMENDGDGTIESLKPIAISLGIDDFAKLLLAPPSTVSRIEHGKQIYDFIADTQGCQLDFDMAIKEPQLIEIITSFFQDLQDYTEIWEELGFAQRVEAIQVFQEIIDELNQHDLWIYGRMCKRKFGNDKAPTLFNILALKVIPKNIPAIITSLQPLGNSSNN